MNDETPTSDCVDEFFACMDLCGADEGNQRYRSACNLICAMAEYRCHRRVKRF